LGANKPTAAVWHKATAEVEAPRAAEGDGLQSLRLLLDAYNEKADYLKRLLYATKNTKLARVIAYYQRAARAIEDLLPEFAPVFMGLDLSVTEDTTATFVQSVDKTELLTCEIPA
jgi:hypothetical protein